MTTHAVPKASYTLPMHTAYREPTNISENTKPLRNGCTSYGVYGVGGNMGLQKIVIGIRDSGDGHTPVTTKACEVVMVVL